MDDTADLADRLDRVEEACDLVDEMLTRAAALCASIEERLAKNGRSPIANDACAPLPCGHAQRRAGRVQG